MKKVLILLAQGCEELEAITIIDLLRRADIDITSAGLDEKPVVCSRRNILIADTDISKINTSDYDMLILPGGQPGANNLSDNPHVIELLKQHSAANKNIAAICAAPRALAAAGLLTDRTITCFPSALNDFSLNHTTISNKAIEKDGNILTSRGPGTAMDFALYIIEVLADKETSERVNQQMVRG